MDLRQLRYFVAIAEEGQITSAARVLKMAQPPLSQQLKLLEDELGTPLFERRARGMRLTDAGRLLLNRARQLIELSDETVREIEDFKGGYDGTLYIGTVSSCGAVLLDENMASFRRNYPGVRFEIHEGNTFQLIELLRRGLIEIGIVRTPFGTADFTCRYAKEEPMVAAMTQKLNPAGGEAPLYVSALKNLPLIVYRRFDALIGEACLASGFEPTVVCENDDARTTVLWANAGLGVAVVPRSAVGLAANQNLVRREIESDRLVTRIAAIWPRGRRLSAPAEKFVEGFGGAGARED